MQARRHGGGVAAVGGGQPLWVDVCLAVGGCVPLLGHSKVDQHLRSGEGRSGCGAMGREVGMSGVGVSRDVGARNGRQPRDCVIRLESGVLCCNWLRLR